MLSFRLCLLWEWDNLLGAFEGAPLSQTLQLGPFGYFGASMGNRAGRLMGQSSGGTLNHAHLAAPGSQVPAGDKTSWEVVSGVISIR